MKVPFFRLSLGENEKKEVLKALDDNWVTTGPKTAELEKKVAQRCHAKYAVGLSSGTAGLLLALKALNLKPGDEVIATPFTMTATIEAVIHAGGKPRLVDIDPITLNIDPAGVERAIGRRTRAIVAVDIAGFPCDYGRLKPLAKKYKLFLLDDAAHSFGAVYKKRPIGSIADATVFSFYPTKNITTGEGGMVVSDRKRLIDRVRHLSLHAMTSSGWRRFRGGNWRYDVTALGYKFNMSDLNAALGIGRLKRFSRLQARRRQLARRYYRGLNDLMEYIELPPKAADIDPARHLFIIKINRQRWRVGRDRLITELERRGVGCGVHYIPVYRFSYYKYFLNVNAKRFPYCEDAYDRVISLPFYPDLLENEVDYVGEVLTSLVRKFGR